MKSIRSNVMAELAIARNFIERNYTNYLAASPLAVAGAGTLPNGSKLPSACTWNALIL